MIIDFYQEFLDYYDGVETVYLKLVRFAKSGKSSFIMAKGKVALAENGREIGIDEDGLTDIATGMSINVLDFEKYLNLDTDSLAKLNNYYINIREEALSNMFKNIQE